MEWHEAITQIEPYVVKISTPQGSGTGWLVSISSKTNYCAIATAAHVINHAHYWEEPIRIIHATSDKSVLLHATERMILIHEQTDSAGLLFDKKDLSLPTEKIKLIPQEERLKAGVEIGWLGFPAIRNAGLSFFSGRISTYVEEDFTYFVDGVAINGVSGGPAFCLENAEFQLIGIVSAYIPNLATGQILPGVAVVRHVAQFHGLAEEFDTIDEAKQKESLPAEAPMKSQDNEKKA